MERPAANVKHENPPSESLELGPNLRQEAKTAPTMNPLEMMCSPCVSEEHSPHPATASPSPTPEPPTANAAEPLRSTNKKTKKRKSWGQVLPEPKTNLPPRKRAKTEDEKEQRRVERVLRNRRAAQSSRERKRLESEALEKRNAELEAMLVQLRNDNMRLVEQLAKSQQTGAAPIRPHGGLTFTPPLFDSHKSAFDPHRLGPSSPSPTVNPASLSPALSPVGEVDEEAVLATGSPADVGPAEASETSPDATQHPAAMLCSDLQCRSADLSHASPPATAERLTQPALALLLQLHLLLSCASTVASFLKRPLMQIAISLRAGSSLPPAQPILNSIVWLVTTPKPRSRLTLKTSSLTTWSQMLGTLSTDSSNGSTSPRPASTLGAQQSSSYTPSLRLKLLRKILTCSPSLARPLSDATLAALRSVSNAECDVERVLGRDVALAAAAAAAAGGSCSPPFAQDQRQRLSRSGSGQTMEDSRLRGVAAPSKEVLVALLWAIRVQESRMQMRKTKKRMASVGSPRRSIVG